MDLITSSQNPLIKHLYKLYHNRSYREEKKRLCIEGTKFIGEIGSFTEIETLLIQEGKNYLPELKAKNMVRVPKNIIDKITETQTHEGFLAEIAMPSPSLHLEAPILALDALQDPGNMGTLLRTAFGFNFKSVLFFEGCCDPFNPKVLRASKGALFHMQWQIADQETLKKLRETHVCLAATLQGKTFDQVKVTDNFLLMLGNEGRGISPDKLPFCEQITIPLHKNLDSLNVAQAGAILMYYYQHG
jgi:RNA methyltransferase, TrmH family